MKWRLHSSVCTSGSAAVIILVAAVLCMSCADKRPAGTEEIRRDSLLTVIREREQVYAMLFGALDRLTEALTQAETLERELEPVVGSPAGMGNREEYLDTAVHRLGELAVRSRAELQVLQRGISRLDSRFSDLSHLKALTERMRERVEEHMQTALKLKRKVYSVLSLRILHSDDGAEEYPVSGKDDIISDNDMLHTAYYIAGTRRELLSKGIVRRSHWFWGPLEVDEECPLEYFDRVDSGNTRVITVGGQEVSMVSTHPDGSYHTVGHGGRCERIVIDDPESFWSKSKVLVVAYRK